MTIRTASYLSSALTPGVLHGITAEKIADLLDSLNAVAGVLHGTDITQAIKTSWAMFTAYEASIDTRGLTPSVAGGTFTVEPGAGGLWVVLASFSLQVPAAGTLEAMLTRNAAATPFATQQYYSANQARQLLVLGLGPLADGDVIGLGIKGSGATTATIHGSQFLAARL